jgi:hypothetical protein
MATVTPSLYNWSWCLPTQPQARVVQVQNLVPFLGVINYLKAIKVSHGRDNRINCGHFDGFERQPELINDAGVPPMESTEEKHHQ